MYKNILKSQRISQAADLLIYSSMRAKRIEGKTKKKSNAIQCRI